MLYIDLPGLQLVLVVFENKQTHLYEIGAMSKLYQFTFQSDYTLAHHSKPRPQHHARSQSPNSQNKDTSVDLDREIMCA